MERDMVSELFYTRKFKKLVRELKKEGNLNHQALYNVNRYISDGFVFSVCSSVFFLALVAFVEGLPMGILASMCCLVFGLAYSIGSSRIICNKYAVLITVGKKTTGVVKYAYLPIITTAARRRYFKYTYEIPDGTTYKKRFSVYPRLSNTEYKVGESVPVYYCETKPKKSVLGLPDLVTKFNLKKQ